MVKTPFVGAWPKLEKLAGIMSYTVLVSEFVTTRFPVADVVHGVNVFIEYGIDAPDSCTYMDCGDIVTLKGHVTPTLALIIIAPLFPNAGYDIVILANNDNRSIFVNVLRFGFRIVALANMAIRTDI
jgi:hypothetical protein